MTIDQRFITDKELDAETLDWGFLEWMCRPGVCEADKLALCRVNIEPGEGHNFHRHPESEEIVYVISGKAEQWVGRNMRLLDPGEMAHIPTNEVHAVFNPGPDTLVILAILSPAETKGPFLVDVFDEEPWKSLRADQAQACVG